MNEYSPFFDFDGNPIDVETFTQLFERRHERHLRWEDMGVEVSTIWLGLNYQFFSGPPLIYETMVFGMSGPMQRYTTWPQAIAGHDQIVAWVREQIGVRHE